MTFTTTAEPAAQSRPSPIRRTLQRRENIYRELNAIPRRILDETGGQIRLTCDEKVVEFLLKETHPLTYRRTVIRQVIDRHLLHPLLRLIYTGQIVEAETFSIEVADDGLSLYFRPARTRQSHRNQLL